MPIRTLQPILVAVLLAAMGCAWAGGAGGDDGPRHEAGGRIAAGEGVRTAEAYLRWPAPFVQQRVVAPYLPAGGRARWAVALGHGEDGSDRATVFALGPTLEYALPADHWRVSLGILPTLLSDYAGDNRNLGGPFEFTSHIGLRWDPHGAWYLGARIQHTSNAGLYDANPGVDLLAVEIGHRF